MERKERFELMEYKHENLMWELNEFMIAVKVHLYNLPVNISKPTVDEMDSLQQRLNQVLKQDAKPLIRR